MVWKTRCASSNKERSRNSSSTLARTARRDSAAPSRRSQLVDFLVFPPGSAGGVRPGLVRRGGSGPPALRGGSRSGRWSAPG
jgi:hypothetical protein